MAIFSIVALALFILSVTVTLPNTAQRLTQAIAEALIVAVVVSLVVEPRLLRFFGEEIASQTFWSSFYSRAPDAYREAIKELASADRFGVYVGWQLRFDWVDRDEGVIKLSVACNNHSENRGSKPQALYVRSFIYESVFPELPADFDTYVTVCQDSAFSSDLFKEGAVRTEHADDGRLLVLPPPDRGQPYFHVPPGQRYTIMTAGTTYVAPMGHFPLVMANPTLKSTIQLSGTALQDLYVSVANPGLGSVRTVIEGIGKELAARGTTQVGGVYITGQSILLSWKRVDR